MSEQAPDTSAAAPEAPSPVLSAASAQIAIDASQQAAAAAPPGDAGKPALPLATGPEVEKVVELGANDDAPAPPPGDDKLARARAAIDRSKRQRKQRQRQAEEAAALRTERDRLAQQAAWDRAERERAEQQLLEVSRDPVAALRARGVDAKKIVEEALAADDQTPEGKIKRLEATVERERAERQQWMENQSRAQAAAAAQRAERDFLEQAKNAETYPTLSRLSKTRASSIIRDANEVCESVFARTHAYPSFEQVLAYLEHEYARALKEEKPGSGPASRGPKPSEGAAPAGAGQPGASASRTLTSRTAEKALLPADIGEMSWEQQREILLQRAKENAG